MKKLDIVAAGLALFSMFFGSGNLIFPLVVGRDVANFTEFSGAVLGFLLTAVVLPFLGVFSIFSLKGDYFGLFQSLGKKFSHLILAILLFCWIPMGSGARCILVSLAASEHLGFMLSLKSFIFSYSLGVACFACYRGKFLDVVGRILTPLLFICLAFMFASGFLKNADVMSSAVAGLSKKSGFLESFKNAVFAGYNTMDLVAAIFFASTLFDLIGKNSYLENKKNLVACIGAGSLALAYTLLIFLSCRYRSFLMNIEQQSLFLKLSHVLLGTKFSWITGLTILLTCFTTSAALMLVFAGHISRYSTKCFHKESVMLGVLLSGLCAAIGFEKLSYFSNYCFSFLYPIVMLILVKSYIFHRKA